MSFNKSAADVIYMNGEYESAAELFLEGAREGSDIAAFNYAWCALMGKGMERDAALAKSFFGFARDLEGGEACYNLAILHMQGDGTPRDLYAALRYMSDAAEMGCVEAMLYLGMAYTVGYMLYPDITSISMIPFHTPVFVGEGTPLLSGDAEEDIAADEELRSTVIRADARRAFEYFSMAAHSDPTYCEDLVAKGKFLYARCFLDGFGTEFNRGVGLKLMLTAGKAGSSDAVLYLAENGITERYLLEAAEAERRMRAEAEGEGADNGSGGV